MLSLEILRKVLSLVPLQCSTSISLILHKYNPGNLILSLILWHSYLGVLIHECYPEARIQSGVIL